jgi:hypothetical protein
LGAVTREIVETLVVYARAVEGSPRASGVTDPIGLMIMKIRGFGGKDWRRREFWGVYAGGEPDQRGSAG